MSLDPDDWASFKAKAHAHLDILLDHVSSVGDGRVWQPVPLGIKDKLNEAPPYRPQGLDSVLNDFNQLVLPYSTGNLHPRFFGWVHGAGTPTGILAEAAAAAMNSNCGGRNHGAILVEQAVLAWFTDLFGLGDKAGGLLVSGTSVANLLAIAIARFDKIGPTIRTNGNTGLPLVGYCSSEAHSCLNKAFEILGLGSDSLRKIPVDSSFRLRNDLLEIAIAEDLQSGKIPFLVAGTAGTVNSGAFDDLTGIADLCRRFDLWYHVDGAFGALTVLNPELKHLSTGLDRADSIAFDMHKWLHVPYEAGCILVRDKSKQVATFGGRPDYLLTGKALAGGDLWPADLGIELSRSFRALKVWFTVKEHGFDVLGQSMAENCRLARSFAAKISAHPFFKLMAPVSLNIVCCRLQPPSVPPEQWDQFNAEVVAHLQESGVAAPSTCRIDGDLCIRICIINHRTRENDMDILLDALLKLADKPTD
jgi:glutamate/tyrosine decarboxylase-like PLP-dependent enzyme